jgi:hypothetical protein
MYRLRTVSGNNFVLPHFQVKIAITEGDFQHRRAAHDHAQNPVVNFSTILRAAFLTISFKWSSGGGKGGSCPLEGQGWPKVVYFRLFEKINILFFRQKVGSSPLENFCPPLEKSLGTHMSFLQNLETYPRKSARISFVQK